VIEALEIVWALLRHPVAKGAIAGALTAAWVDYGAFRKWQSWKDVADYDWAVASWRWFQGAFVGALTGLGLLWTP
jgi:hypothetical protein